MPGTMGIVASLQDLLNLGLLGLRGSRNHENESEGRGVAFQHDPAGAVGPVPYSQNVQLSAHGRAKASACVVTLQGLPGPGQGDGIGWASSGGFFYDLPAHGVSSVTPGEIRLIPQSGLGDRGNGLRWAAVQAPGSRGPSIVGLTRARHPAPSGTLRALPGGRWGEERGGNASPLPVALQLS